MITDRNEGESLADWVFRSNGNCCDCPWVEDVIPEVEKLEARIKELEQTGSDRPSALDG